MPEIRYSYETSTVASWKLSEPGREVEIDGVIEFEAPDTSLDFIEAFDILPVQMAAVVRRAALEALTELPVAELAFHKCNVACSNGVCSDFVVARPLIQRICTDIETSEVEWIRENDYFVWWRKLHLLPDCLGGASIVRERYCKLMVISDGLKSKLERLEPYGVAFTRPEGTRMGFRS